MTSTQIKDLLESKGVRATHQRISVYRAVCEHPVLRRFMMRLKRIIRHSRLRLFTIRSRRCAAQGFCAG